MAGLRHIHEFYSGSVRHFNRNRGKDAMKARLVSDIMIATAFLGLAVVVGVLFAGLIK
jgi:hypothetical protein